MARRIRNVKGVPEAPKNLCRDCAYSYDWHNRGADGAPIFCRCPHDAKSEHGKLSKFLSDYQCGEHFKKRQKQ